jgi:RimJ/RimL family protein N-acetyltransferase
VFAIEAEAAPDIPGYDEGAPRYEEWLARTWNAPDAAPDLSVVAVVDGVPAAYTVVLTDGEAVYWSAMTGTRRAYRGRGLARLVKITSLHRARAAGLTVAVTGNDDENAAIIAVNDRLGYRPAVTLWRYDKR